jgi:hypothetical protein
MWCPDIQYETIFFHYVRNFNSMRARDWRIVWLYQASSKTKAETYHGQKLTVTLEDVFSFKTLIFIFYGLVGSL